MGVRKMTKQINNKKTKEKTEIPTHNKDTYKEIFEGLQKEYIVSGISITLSNEFNGNYSFKDAREGKSIPIDVVRYCLLYKVKKRINLFYKITYKIFKRPIKQEGHYIKSPCYTGIVDLPDKYSAKLAVSLIKEQISEGLTVKKG
jgi:hypothetical protein